MIRAYVEWLKSQGWRVKTSHAAYQRYLILRGAQVASQLAHL